MLMVDVQRLSRRGQDRKKRQDTAPGLRQSTRDAARGQLSIPITSPVPATIRQDPAEKRVYLGVENITVKLEQIKARRGTIEAPRFEVKGVAVLALFRDRAGNRMGLV